MDQHDLKRAPRPAQNATLATMRARITELERTIVTEREARNTITIEKSAELVQLNIESVVAKYAPVEAALRSRVAELESALRAIVAITDGSQPKDYPGALMVARAALKGN